MRDPEERDGSITIARRRSAVATARVFCSRLVRHRTDSLWRTVLRRFPPKSSIFSDHGFDFAHHKFSRVSWAVSECLGLSIVSC
jgi:hypothetical protein